MILLFLIWPKISLFRCLDDLLLPDVPHVVSDVPLDALVEQHRLLAHDPEGPSQLVDVVVANVVALEEDIPLRRLVEAQQQLENGGLAAARSPHEGHFVALSDAEVDAAEGVVLSTFVPETDVLELYVSFYRIGQHFRAPSDLQLVFVLLVNDRKY
jgi:hypothetical protein